MIFKNIPSVGQSCEGRCGDNLDPNEVCQCNDQCADFGDCCDDYEELCRKFLCIDATLKKPITSKVNDVKTVIPTELAVIRRVGHCPPRLRSRVDEVQEVQTTPIST